MAKNLRAFVVLAILAVKICETIERSLPRKDEAQLRAHAGSSGAGNGAVTTYFKHDPYGNNTYAFGYEVDDNRTGNVQFRDERRYTNGSVEGTFGYVRPDGRVTVTRFTADADRGYLSKTDTFDAHEKQQWATHWPAKMPSAAMELAESNTPTMPTMPIPVNADDNKEELKLSDNAVPEHVANAVMQQYGLNLHDAGTLEQNLISPIVLDIVNGKVPLQQHESSKSDDVQLGFETVHNFIPADFPIAPFEVPKKTDDEMAASDKVPQKQHEHAHVEQQQLTAIDNEAQASEWVLHTIAEKEQPPQGEQERYEQEVDEAEEVQQKPEEPKQETDNLEEQHEEQLKSVEVEEQGEQQQEQLKPVEAEEQGEQQEEEHKHETDEQGEQQQEEPKKETEKQEERHEEESKQETEEEEEQHEEEPKQETEEQEEKHEEELPNQEQQLNEQTHKEHKENIQEEPNNEEPTNSQSDNEKENAIEEEQEGEQHVEVVNETIEDREKMAEKPLPADNAENDEQKETDENGTATAVMGTQTEEEMSHVGVGVGNEESNVNESSEIVQKLAGDNIETSDVNAIQVETQPEVILATNEGEGNGNIGMSWYEKIIDQTRQEFLENAQPMQLA